ncbi:MAG: GMP synthase [Bacteroidia bacterium]|nr:GMP synthase [Bacteroidia bacterium]
MTNQKLRLTILDMNNGQPNQGMRCIREIVSEFSPQLDWDEYNVRVRHEVPNLDYDIYICSGGPGNPLVGDGIWEVMFYDLIDRLWAHNQKPESRKKFVFFICHSFQMACNHFGLGEIAPRKSTSFGVMPVHKTPEGMADPLLKNLPDPYYAVESRDWQLIQPNLEVFAEHGATILSLEKIRTHVEYERAIMAVRFSDEFVGTQFHPEADPVGMTAHFQKEENRRKVIDNFSEKKYHDMMAHLNDPDKIALTHSTILPSFITGAITSLRGKSILSV